MAAAITFEGNVFVATHGRAEKNEEGAHGNVGDRLLPAGIIQAQHMAAYIIERTILLADSVGRKTINVVASTYARCEETAARIRQTLARIALSLSLDVNTSLYVQPSLRGINLGELDGLTYQQMAAIAPGYIRDLMAWQQNQTTTLPDIPRELGGRHAETNADFAIRMCLATRDTLERFGGDVIALALSSSAAMGTSVALQHGLEPPVAGQAPSFAYFPTPSGTVEEWRVQDSIISCVSPGFCEPQVSPQLFIPGQPTSYQQPLYT